MDYNLFLNQWLKTSPIKNPLNYFFYFVLNKNKMFLPDFYRLKDNKNLITKENKIYYLSIFGEKEHIHNELKNVLSNPNDYYRNYCLNISNQWGADYTYKEISDNIKILFNYRFSIEDFNLIWVTLLLKDILNFNNIIGQFDVENVYNSLIEEIKVRQIKLTHLKTKKKYQLFDFYANNTYTINNSDELIYILKYLTVSLLLNQNMFILEFPNNEETNFDLALSGLATNYLKSH